MSEIVNFVDILKPRNTQFGIIKFMTRSWDPVKTLKLEKYYTPQELKNVVADSVYIDSLLEAESIRSGITTEQLKKDVLKYLEEIAMDKKLHVIRWMGIAFLKICFMMKIGVYVNEAAILKIKSSMGHNPVLFLPTHRSYADFCLMTYLCYHYDIDLPAVAAGMDFYSMAVVGQSMRETGAFYIRRTLAGTPLYAATLRGYVRALVAKYHAPLEFFLEGTRSRSNKSLPPKYGMLSMSLLPYFSREVSDVTVVPVNISYDRLVELELFAYEHLGVPKPKETTGGLLKSLHKLNDHYGNIYVNLGEPVSVRDYVGQKFNLSSEMSKPLDLQQLTNDQFNSVRNIANYTVSKQQQCTVVTISNLISIVLMESLVNNEALGLEQVLEEIEWLIQVLKNLGASVFENDVKSSVERILVVHKNLMKLDKDNRLRLVSGTLMKVDSDIQNKMKGHTLKAETMVNAVPIIQLQLYVNPVLYYLVPPALVYLLTKREVKTKEELYKNFLLLRALLRHEFFHLENTIEDDFNKAYDYCTQNDVISSALRSGGNGRLQRALALAAAPALGALRACARVLLQYIKCEHKQALKLVQEYIEMEQYHPYSLSLESIANCLSGLVLCGALMKHKLKQEVVYVTVPTKLTTFQHLVTSVLPKININYGNTNAVFTDIKAVAAKL